MQGPFMNPIKNNSLFLRFHAWMIHKSNSCHGGRSTSPIRNTSLFEGSTRGESIIQRLAMQGWSTSQRPATQGWSRSPIQNNSIFKAPQSMSWVEKGSRGGIRGGGVGGWGMGWADLVKICLSNLYGEQNYMAILSDWYFVSPCQGRGGGDRKRKWQTDTQAYQLIH